MAVEPVLVRPGTSIDLPAVAAIQAACPQAAQWPVEDYLVHDLLIAENSGQVAGFAVVRALAAGESELLNLAVAPGQRRRGTARRLLEHAAERHPGALFLEVRVSNREARRFYEVFGFQEVGRRAGYYESPSESAVVMKFYSCYCHR